MNYDEQSFLAGLAVGRQLKGWGAGGGGAYGFRCIATGEKELVNRQGETEFNRILLPAGTRYCTMYIPGGYMYIFAAGEEPVALRCFSNDREELQQETGRVVLGDRTYYYSLDGWYTPLPTPLVPCVTPVRDVGSGSLSSQQIITQGILYLYGC